MFSLETKIQKVAKFFHYSRLPMVNRYLVNKDNKVLNQLATGAFVGVLIVSGLFGSLQLIKAEETANVIEETGEAAPGKTAIFNPVNHLPALLDMPLEILPQKIFQAADIAINANSALVYDVKSGKFIFEKNADAKQPIASITKLMTALVFVDKEKDLEKEYEIKEADILPGGKSHVYKGDIVRYKDLLQMALVASDNTAAKCLASASGMNESDYVKAMNLKAKEIGLTGAVFVDPTGLDAGNMATAKDIAFMVREAVRNERIRPLISSRAYSFETKQGRKVSVKTTNMLLDDFSKKDIKILGGKTGFIESAGYCLASSFVKNGNEVVSVVLGAPTAYARFSETSNLITWIYNNFKW